MMRVVASGGSRIELQLAHLLGYGTWLGTALIAIGLIRPSFASDFLPRPLSVMSLGVLVLIALPVVRVVVMLWNFVRTGERVFAWFAVIVLAIMALGLLVGASG